MGAFSPTAPTRLTTHSVNPFVAYTANIEHKTTREFLGSIFGPEIPAQICVAETGFAFRIPPPLGKNEGASPVEGEIMRRTIFRGAFKRCAIMSFLAPAARAAFGSGSASAAVMG